MLNILGFREATEEEVAKHNAETAIHPEKFLIFTNDVQVRIPPLGVSESNSGIPLPRRREAIMATRAKKARENSE